MTKNILFKLSLIAMVVACLFGIQFEAKAAGTITLSQTSSVTVTFISSSSDFNNAFGITSPQSREFGYGHVLPIGSQFNLSNVLAEELVFYIRNGIGQTFYTGSASRNFDNTDHALVTVLGSNQWKISFEDLASGGDRDYNDIEIMVSAVPSCVQNVAKQCVGNNVYWFDSCNVQGSLFQTCTANQICQNNQCQNVTCFTNSDCNDNNASTQDVCLNPGTVNSTCQHNPITITCSSNAQCGTDGYVGSPICSTGFGDQSHIVGVYQSYRTYTCSNPGSADSFCSNSTVSQLKESCTANKVCQNGACVNQNITCSSSSDCNDNNANTQDVCLNPGTINSTCQHNPITITCSSNSQCGTNGYTGSPFCQGSNIYQNYITYTCNNAGTANSYCSSNTAAQQKDSCSSNQTCSNGSCSNTQNCTYHSYQRCVGNYLYWYDSCGNQQDSQYCSNGCYNNSCQNYNNNCTQNSYQRCVGNYLYWYDSCGNQQSNNYQYCQNGCYNNSCQNYNNNCTYHSYQRCVGNYLYWYDSCGNQQDSQYCSNGCYNNSCGYSNYGACTYHAYKLCLGNNIYWYDSCGNQQDLYQTCVGNNMICQYGQCVIRPTILGVQTVYSSYYKISCYAGNLYWYDTNGAKTGLYRSCSDNNSCTTDSCDANKCVNTIKCDGSTCAVGTPDYNSYCASYVNTNTNTNTNSTTTNISGLSLSFFAKENQNLNQWQKTVKVNANGQVYFMASVANNSSAQINNLTISANIPTEISSLGNLQVNGVPVSGDIVSGINIGSIAAGTSKSITFEGRTQSFSTQGAKQATVSAGGQIDSVSLDFDSDKSAASISSTAESTGFMAFLKRWYLWILVALVLIFLFFVVFRRLSSNS